MLSWRSTLVLTIGLIARGCAIEPAQPYAQPARADAALAQIESAIRSLYALAATARREILIVHAYIIPTQRTIGSARQLHANGVSIKALTNSLATHDVPAVNSHYKQWRRQILAAGAELYEMAVIVDSPGLAAELAAVIERDLQPANRWRVSVDEQGRLSWTHDRETVHMQPARSWWQRVEDVFFMAFPERLY
jgi:cardiolipin synthase C